MSRVYMRACRLDEWKPAMTAGWGVWENSRYFIMKYDETLTAIDKRTGDHTYSGDNVEELQEYCQLDGNAWGQVYCE